MPPTSEGKIGYMRMCRVLGNGTDGHGRDLLQAVTLKLEDSRRNKALAQNQVEADVYLGLTMEWLRYAVQYGDKHQKMEAAVSAIAAIVRFTHVCT